MSKKRASKKRRWTVTMWATRACPACESPFWADPKVLTPRARWRYVRACPCGATFTLADTEPDSPWTWALAT